MRRRVRNNGFCCECQCVVGSSVRAAALAGGGPQACPAGCAPNIKPYFVILSGAKNLFPCEPKAADGLCRARRRKTNEVQSRICLRILDTDSSSIDTPQNDNAVFALNRFRSGTHSGARPGRLWGSHLRCEPAPGARSQTLKHYLPIVRKLRSRLEYATGGNAER